MASEVNFLRLHRKSGKRGGHFQQSELQEMFSIGNEHLSTLTELDYNSLVLNTMSEQIFVPEVMRLEPSLQAPFPTLQQGAMATV